MINLERCSNPINLSTMETNNISFQAIFDLWIIIKLIKAIPLVKGVRSTINI